MNSKAVQYISVLSLLVQSCAAAVTDSQFSTLDETLTPTLEIALTATFTPTILPTLHPTPTLIVPEQLGTCFRADELLQAYGCVVTTFAGGAEFSFGDGASARNAELAMPTDLLVTDDGYLFISDSLHNRIRRVNPNGIIGTYVGSGPYFGSVVDGLPAIETGLRRPSGLAIGTDGLLYFSDTKGYVVRRVEEDGTVETVVGDDTPAANQQEPYGDGGLASKAWIDQPDDIAFDGEGNLYIADAVNHRVRRVGNDGIISTIPVGDLQSPQALAIDSLGRLFIGNSNLMRVYNVYTGAIGIMSNESLRGVTALAISERDELFFASPSSNQVGRILISDTSFPSDEIQTYSGGVTIIAGTGIPGYEGDGGQARTALLNYPHGLALDKTGNLYIADTHNHVVRMVDPGGTIITVVGSTPHLLSRDPIPYDKTIFNTTNGLVFDVFGNLFITDFDLYLIRKIDTFGFVHLIAGDGIGRFSGDGGHPLEASVGGRAPVFDSAGNLFFIDNETVRRISPGADGEVNGSPDEIISTVVGVPGGVHRRIPKGIPVYNVPGRQAEFEGIRGMDFDSMGNLFIADWAWNTIVMVSPGADGIITGANDELLSVVAGSGEPRTSGTGGLAIDAHVRAPNWVAVDSMDNVYFREETAEGFAIIRKINRETGIIETVGSFDLVTFTFDQADNLVYSDSSRIYRIDAVTGQRALIAGVGTGGYSGFSGGYFGDGGDAREAEFQSIFFLTIDAEGNLYIDDSGNYRIRKITFLPLE